MMGQQTTTGVETGAARSRTLATPTRTAEVIARHGFTLRKKYGQNFLVDESMVAKIVEAAELTREDAVLEIGPGLGTMTQLLAREAGEVVAVEIDRMLIPVLEDTLKDCGNVTLVHADIMKLDLDELGASRGWTRPCKVVANLPYYITTPILLSLLERTGHAARTAGRARIGSITVMVQREVAERMQAGPGGKDYGALSLAVQYRAAARIVCTVPRECFYPRPAVESAVVQLCPYEELPVCAHDEARLFTLIRAAFMQRRKTLANAASHEPSLRLTRAQVEDALVEMGIDVMVRGEALTLAQFAALSDRLG